MIERIVVLGVSVLPIWWDGSTKAGMPSVYLGLKGLVDKGHEVHYLTQGAEGLPVEEEVDGIHVHRFTVPFPGVSAKPILNTLSRWFLWLQVAVCSSLAASRIARACQPDILYGHTYYGVPAAAFLSRRLGKPYVYREYGTLHLYKEIQTFLGRLKRFHEILAMRLPAAAYIFTDDGSQSDKAAIQLGVSPYRIKFWKNGLFQFDGSDERRRDLRAALGYADGDIICATAGRLVPNKYVAEILEALAQLRDARIKLCVMGDGPCRDQLENLARTLRVDSQVRFTGAIDREKVADHFCASDMILALGSINPVLESMAMGRPVISLELGSTHELIENGENGTLIQSTNPATIAEAIRSLVTDTSLREKMAAEARESVFRRYPSWEERIRREVELVEALTNGGLTK